MLAEELTAMGRDTLAYLECHLNEAHQSLWTCAANAPEEASTLRRDLARLVEAVGACLSLIERSRREA
jgi:hypothetical protein